MKTAIISTVQAIEILDSRGNPTVRVCVELSGGKTFLTKITSA